MRKVAKNAQCPCGTGKTYKDCCYEKDFTWMVDDDGNYVREVPLSQEADALLLEQERRFVEKHGRKPEPTDPIFFDMPPLERVEHETVAAMRSVGVDPALVYAYERTGLLVSTENLGLIPEADLRAWEAAVDEYRAMHPESAPSDFADGNLFPGSRRERTLRRRLRKLDRESLVSLAQETITALIDLTDRAMQPLTPDGPDRCGYCGAVETVKSDGESVMAHDDSCPMPTALYLADSLDDWMDGTVRYGRMSDGPPQKPSELCACGSGRLHRSCCYARWYTWFEAEPPGE